MRPPVARLSQKTGSILFLQFSGTGSAAPVSYTHLGGGIFPVKGDQTGWRPGSASLLSGDMIEPEPLSFREEVYGCAECGKGVSFSDFICTLPCLVTIYACFDLQH